MVPYSVWRQAFRIPWVRENSDAVRFLSDVFYLLLALYRSHRFHDLQRLQSVYFRMIDSFAQNGRAEAKDTVDNLLTVPWFGQRKRDVYRLIVSYNRIVEQTEEGGGGTPGPFEAQTKTLAYIDDFVRSFKAITDFRAEDEARVDGLVEDTEAMDAMLAEIFAEVE
jgi:hypothetical protein